VVPDGATITLSLSSPEVLFLLNMREKGKIWNAVDFADVPSKVTCKYCSLMFAANASCIKAQLQGGNRDEQACDKPHLISPEIRELLCGDGGTAKRSRTEYRTMFEVFGKDSTRAAVLRLHLWMLTASCRCTIRLLQGYGSSCPGSSTRI
jgi:hypothetical protein